MLASFYNYGRLKGELKRNECIKKTQSKMLKNKILNKKLINREKIIILFNKRTPNPHLISYLFYEFIIFIIAKQNTRSNT